jgi:uncharacterized membrane protein
MTAGFLPNLIRNGSELIEFVGALLVVGYVASAVYWLIRRPGTEGLLQARLLVAQGAITGLDFKLAATLLHTLGLHAWRQIGVFAVIFLLRTILKRLFTWEKAQLIRRSHA